MEGNNTGALAWKSWRGTKDGDEDADAPAAPGISNQLSHLNKLNKYMTQTNKSILADSGEGEKAAVIRLDVPLREQTEKLSLIELSLISNSDTILTYHFFRFLLLYE